MRSVVLPMCLTLVGACGRGPLDPDHLSHVATLPEPTYGLAIDGDRLFANTYDGIEIVRGEQVVGSLASSPPAVSTSGAILVDGSTVFAADGYGFDVIDATDPSAPKPVTTIQDNAMIGGLARFGTSLYVTDTSSLMIYDAGDPHAPTLREATGPGGYQAHTDGNRLFVASDFGIAQVYLDGGTVSFATSGHGPVHSVDTTPGYVYGTNADSLLWALEDDRQLQSATSPIAGGPNCVRVLEDRLLVGSEDGTISFFDLTEPISPKLLGTMSADGPIHDFAADADHLYVATTAGLEIYAR